MNRVELISNRRTTTAFIRADSETIIIQRPTKVKNVRGGVDREPMIELDPQQVHLGRYNSTGGDELQTQSGQATYLRDLLVGRWDMDIEVSDEFTVSGILYCVDFVEPDRTYQTRARLTTGHSGKGES